MSIHIKDMKDLKMYKGSTKLFIPLNPDDNEHGSLIYLLTPDISSSIDMINNNMIINRNWFKSYYIDKSINAIIKADTGEIQEFVQYEDENTVFITAIISGTFPDLESVFNKRRNNAKTLERNKMVKALERINCFDSGSVPSFIITNDSGYQIRAWQQYRKNHLRRKYRRKDYRNELQLSSQSFKKM